MYRVSVELELMKCFTCIRMKEMPCVLIKKKKEMPCIKKNPLDYKEQHHMGKTLINPLENPTHLCVFFNQLTLGTSSCQNIKPRYYCIRRCGERERERIEVCFCYPAVSKPLEMVKE